MAKLICRNKDCNCTYFEKVRINEFHDYGGSLYSSLPEVEIDNDVKGYKCIACGTITLPTLDYTNSQLDRDLASNLLLIVEGNESQAKPKLPKSRRVAPGTVRPLSDEERDPSQDGKFVRK